MFALVNDSMTAWAQTKASMAVAVAVAINRPAQLIGVGCLVITAVGWGLNWPATKFLLEQCPPLTARGIAGIVASLALAGIAVSRGETLAVPRPLWWWLIGSALLNVSAWMGLTTLSLVWLNAGEAATLAYTMPVWAALLAWPVLGERLVPRKIAALALGVCGVVVLLGGNGFSADRAKLPGVAIALAAAMLFALGTVLCKRRPLNMTPIAMTAWQVGIGCIVLLGASFVLEHPHLRAMHWFGWAALSYTAAVSLGICYITWFAALRRLEAGTAAIGTLLTPIIGVVASAIALGEPLLFPQFASLALVITGIILAVRPS
jgi:drug/metabolite transporter (DMT)-like permease